MINPNKSPSWAIVRNFAFLSIWRKKHDTELNLGWGSLLWQKLKPNFEKVLRRGKLGYMKRKIVWDKVKHFVLILSENMFKTCFHPKIKLIFHSAPCSIHIAPFSPTWNKPWMKNIYGTQDSGFQLAISPHAQQSKWPNP
jgi:hypothetical protein